MFRLFFYLIFVSYTSVSISEELSDKQRQELAMALLQQSNSSYVSGDFEKTAHFLEESLKQWTTNRAASNLCSMYLYGYGIGKNLVKAKELCEIAAELEDINAFVMLGEMHYNGMGMPVNRDLGTHYYLMAASKGHIHAEYVMGTLLIEASPEEAKIYLSRAAMKGHEEAKDFLSKVEKTANK